MPTDVEMRAKADFAELERKIDKVGQAFERSEKRVKELTKTVGKLERENSKLKDQVKAVDDQQEDTYGARALTRLGSYAAGALTVTAAVGAIKQAWDEVLKSGEKALANIKDTEFAVGEAGQLATKPGDVMGQEMRIAQIMVAGGMEDRGKAAGLFKALESSRQGEHWKMYSGLHRFALTETPDAVAAAASFVQTGFGKEETGSMPSIVAKMFAGSAESLAMAVPYAQATKSMGQPMSKIGISDEEALAALAVASEGQPVEEAGIALGALADVMGVRDIKGGTFIEKLGGIQKATAGMSPKDYKEFFGRKGARHLYGALMRKRDRIGEMETKITAAGEDPEEFLAAMQTRQMESPLRRTLIETRAARARLAVKEATSPRRWGELAGEEINTKTHAALEGTDNSRTYYAFMAWLSQITSGKTEEPAHLSYLAEKHGAGKILPSVSREEWDVFAEKVRGACELGTSNGVARGGPELTPHEPGDMEAE